MSLPLEIVVTANTSGVTPGLTTVTNELGKVAVAAQKSDSSLQTFGNALSSFSTKGQQSIFNLTEKLRDLKSAVFTEKDPAKIAAINSQIQTTEGAITKLSNVGKTGFDNLGNAITKSTGNPLTQAYSGLRQLAYILPGIGISGILAFASGPIIEYLSALLKTDDAAKLFSDTLDASASTAAKAVENVSRLREEINLAKEGFLKKSQVVKDYNDTIGKTTGLVNNLDEAEKALNKNAEAYIKFTFLKAVANEANAQSAKKAVEASIAAIKPATELVSNQEAFGAVLKNLFSHPFDNASDALGHASVKLVKTAEKNRKDIVDQANSDSQALALLAKNAGDEAALLAKQFNFNPFEDTKASTKETIASVLRKLAIQIDFLNQKQITLKTDEAQAKISAIESTVDHLLQKFKLLGSNPIIINLLAQINDIQLTEEFKKILKGGGKDQKIIIPEQIQLEMQKPTVEFPPGTFDESILRQQLLEKLAALGIKDTIPIKIGVDITGQDINAGSEEVTTSTPTAKLDATLAAAEKKIKDFNKKITDDFNSIVSNSLESVAQDIGAAFAGTISGEQIFGDIFKVIGEGLKTIGAALIEYGVGLKAFKAIFHSPAAAIAAGFALELFGSFIQNAIPKFAGGVRNFGGGVALVGEQGPELVTLPQGSNVIPNNQINGYSGGTQVFIPQVEIKGANLLIVFNRAQAQASRNG